MPGTTGRARLGLTYAAGASGPATVFVKLPPFDADQRRLVARTDMGRREARFYAGPARDAPLRIPSAYYAAHGEPTEYVMVLEDLEASGCTFSNRLETHAETHGQDLVESLGRLHARFWNDPRFEDELSWIQPAMRGSYGAKLVAMARERFAGDLPPVFDELCGLFIDNYERIAEVWDEGERTVIHGDTHAGNQFIDGDHVGLYDWAVISRSPGVRDLAIYLGNSCPAEVRRESEEPWLRRYREVLVESGVDAPDLGVLFDRYRRTVLYRVGGGHDDRGDGEQVAADRDRNRRDDAGDGVLCRPRHPRGAAVGPLTGRPVRWSQSRWCSVKNSQMMSVASIEVAVGPTMNLISPKNRLPGHECPPPSMR